MLFIFNNVYIESIDDKTWIIKMNKKVIAIRNNQRFESIVAEINNLVTPWGFIDFVKEEYPDDENIQLMAKAYERCVRELTNRFEEIRKVIGE